MREAAACHAAVFWMSPREALATDAPPRLLLETSWEEFERDGSGRTAGMSSGTDAPSMRSPTKPASAVAVGEAHPTGAVSGRPVTARCR
ncbi:beta-ketoacyl synthase N-terminal-like domain-containing protein, partial [Streptomyces sp. SP17BM10]|uniref:beta-ketoacyl synthase N-terminal-like domain-containing protein n=1 Tax=Streptomyces sp. SP17BM10 TaxID=3002530 RepID=UPI003FCDE835